MAEQATAPPAPYGNRSQGSDGTAAQVSADDAARGSEEVETAAALPGTLPTRMQPFLRNVVPDETPPGEPVPSYCAQAPVRDDSVQKGVLTPSHQSILLIALPETLDLLSSPCIFFQYDLLHQWQAACSPFAGI